MQKKQGRKEKPFKFYHLAIIILCHFLFDFLNPDEFECLCDILIPEATSSLSIFGYLLVQSQLNDTKSSSASIEC